MKKYIKPTIKVKTLNADSNFLAASGTKVGISDDSAYEPACAKQQSFFGMDEDPNAASSKSSVWDE